MKCADCHHDHACDKKGKDCTGGTLDLSEYKDPTLRPYLTISGALQHHYGNNLTRLQELMHFARINGYGKIGIIACAGLREEGLKLLRVLEREFAVEMVTCERCGTTNSDFVLHDARRREVFTTDSRDAVNALNAVQADLNVAVGLCVEQDVIVTEHTNHPLTVLAVQDWHFGHNPLAVVYGSYPRKKLLQGKGLPKPGQQRLMRIQEIIRFAQEMDVQTVGLGFCVGLSDEAKVIADILKQYFKVFSACCKLSGLDKKDFDVPYANAGKEFECTCNPIGQAKAMNAKHTELNVSLGLCIGHDILFARYSEPPVTVLSPKDRVLGNNPLAALYCVNQYQDYLVG